MTIGGSVEVGNTFGTETTGSLQLGLAGPRIETKIKQESTHKVVASQSLQVPVPPGQQVRTLNKLLLCDAYLRQITLSFSCTIF